MFDFNVGGLYQIKLNNGAYRIIVLGYRTYFEEKPLYFYDLDNCCFGECLREDILNYKSIDINVIQNEELRNKLLNFQRRFPSIVKKEREEDIKLAKIRKTYEVVKARYDKAYNDYNQSIYRFYDIEAEGNRLGLELVGSNFTLNNQEMNNSLLSESEFADRIWHYMNPEIKKLLVGSPRFYLSFKAVTNNDDGCFYEFVIYRDRLLEYSYPIRYNTREYHQILQKEIKKRTQCFEMFKYLIF